MPAAAAAAATGRFVWPSGATYVGEFAEVDGVRSMHGRGRYVDGYASYDGDFERGLFHGRGVFVGASGCVYEGGFAEGAFSGHGVYRWTDGAVYTGGWKQGLMHGEGSYSSADGVLHDGTFFAGLFVSGGTHVAVRATA